MSRKSVVQHGPWKGRDYSYFLLFTMGMHYFIGSLLGHIFIYVHTVVWSYLIPHSLLTTPSPQISSYIYVFEKKKQRGKCLTMLPWLAWNSLCGLGWSWTHKRFTYLCLPNAKKTREPQSSASVPSQHWDCKPVPAHPTFSVWSRPHVCAYVVYAFTDWAISSNQGHWWEGVNGLVKARNPGTSLLCFPESLSALTSNQPVALVTDHPYCKAKDTQM